MTSKLIIVAPVYADAVTYARSRGLPRDRWLWHSQYDGARRWIERAEAKRSTVAATIVVAGNYVREAA